MKSNMSNLDRAIRIIAAIAMAYFVFDFDVTGTWAAVFLTLSAIFIITSIVKFCPLYVPFKIRTNKKKG